MKIFIYGGVQVPREVEKVLKLLPKFAIYPKLYMRMVEMEVERGIWKARWEDRSEEQRGRREEMTEEQVEEVMAETRVWDDDAKELNYRKIAELLHQSHSPHQVETKRSNSSF